MIRLYIKWSKFLFIFLLLTTSVAWANQALVLGGVGATEDQEVNFVKQQIKLTGLYDSVDIIKNGPGTPTPTLAQLNPYQLIVILNSNSGRFGNSGALGDVLDDYMNADASHAVLVFLPFVWYDTIYGVGGRFITNHALMPQTTSLAYASTTLDTGSIVSHPITQGVSAFSCGTDCYRLMIKTVPMTTQVVAKWADGSILAAYGEGNRRVDLNMLPFDNTIGSGSYDPTADQLIQNAVAFLAITSFKTTPSSFLLADTGAGGQRQVDGSMQNTTTTSVSITSMTIQGADAGAFQVSLKSGKMLPTTMTPLVVDSMKNLDFVITFKPTSVGHFQASLLVTTASSGSTWIQLDGHGIDSTLTSSLGTVDFGARATIVTPPKKTITISNLLSAMANRTITSMDLKDKTAFQLGTLPGLPALLSKGGSFDVDITFNPKSKGFFSTTLEIVSDDPASPLVIPIQGRYGDPKLVIPYLNFVLSPQTVGTMGPPQTIALNNDTGDADVEITSIVSSDPTVFVVVNPPSTMNPLVIPAGENRSFQVYFEPSSLGLKAATVTVAGNVPSQVVNLSAEGDYPQFSLDTNSLSYGNVTFGTQTVRTVNVSNPGKIPLTIKSLQLTSRMGMSTSAFTILYPTTLPTRVYPGHTLPIQIACTPSDITALGALAANLVITTDAHVDANKQVTLDATGVGGWLSLSAAEVIFDQVAINTTKQQTIQLTNVGDSDVVITSAVVADNSMDLGNTLQATLPTPGTTLVKGGSLNIPIKFSSSMVGTFSDRIQIKTTNQNLNFILRGTALSPQISLTPMQLNFSPTLVGGKSNIQTSVVKNTGVLPITGLSVVFTGGVDDRAFQILPGFKTDLMPGEQNTLQFIFAPSQAKVSQSAQLRLTGNGIALATISLQGTAIQTSLEIHPAEIHFQVTKAPKEAGMMTTKTVDITNSSSVAVRFIPRLQGGTEGPFSISWPVEFGETDVTLQSGENVTITVGFKSDKNGIYEDELDLISPNNSLLASVSLEAQQKSPPTSYPQTGCSVSASLNVSSLWLGWAALVVLAIHLGIRRTLLKR